MTTPTAPQITLPFTIPTGGTNVRLTDGAGNTPAGLTLVNRGDNGGTVWISSGPSNTAAAVPLGAGGTLQWTDPGVFPYAYLSTSATKPETLVVTSQAAGYANPATVAGALIAQGIPSTFLDGPVAAAASIGPGQVWPVANPANVSQYASLLVQPTWPTTGTQGAQVLTLQFGDDNLAGFPTTQLALTTDNSVENSSNPPLLWQVPVLGPTLYVANQRNTSTIAPATVNIVGTNRAVPVFRQIGAEMGVTQLTGSCADTAAHPLLNITGGSRLTRYNGHVQLATATQGVAGILSASWVDESGTGRAYSIFTGTGGNELYDFAHPSVPVWWTYQAHTASAGNGMTLSIFAK